ncbi:MAG: hypothetical protein LAQ30_16795, partial [Acidobacteriia bacterium]|nr:hypothetical protein [Terriglobia bacterium]
MSAGLTEIRGLTAPGARCRSLAGAALPPYAIAALEALRFEGRSTVPLSRLKGREWRDLLNFSDPAQLTLLLGHDAGHALPGWVRERIRENARDYAPRFGRLKRSLLEIAGALDARGI